MSFSIAVHGAGAQRFHVFSEGTFLGEGSFFSSNDCEHMVAGFAKEVFSSPDHTFTISEADRGAFLLHAAQQGHTLLVKMLLLSGRPLKQHIINDAARFAATHGHTDILECLLSDGRTIEAAAFEFALRKAVEGKHTSTVRFLLSDGRTIAGKPLDRIASRAVQNNDPDTLRILLSDGRIMDERCLGWNVTMAASNGHVETLSVLLKVDCEISLEYLRWAGVHAADNGHEECVLLLLSDTQLRDDPDITYLLSSAISQGMLRTIQYCCTDGHAADARLTTFMLEHASARAQFEIVSFLLSDGRVFSEEEVGLAVTGAAREGHEEMVYFLLSHGRTISQEALDNAIHMAIHNGQDILVHFLLSEGRRMSEEARYECILCVADIGAYDILERLLQHGPIPAQVRDTAITVVRGPFAGAMRDILTAVPVIDAPAAAASAAAAGTSRMRLTFADVQANPETYLRAVCDDGFPRGIHLEDQPHVVDLGGVTKQFITTLITALVKKGILTLTGSEFPLAKDAERKEALTQLGRFCSLLDKRNEERTDKFVIGQLFHPPVFDLVQRIHAAADPEAKRRCAAELLRDDSSAGMYAKVFLPAEAAAAASAGGSGAATLAAVLMCSEEEALEAAQEEIEAYVVAAEAFLAGMTEEFTAQLLGADPAAFAERLQGQPASKEAILAALQSDEGVPEEQFTWLRERITASDEAWRRKFLAAVTGNETLPAGVTIRIARHSIPVFELHTCFNSIHLPGVTLGEEAFKAGLDAAITGAGYETA